LVDQPLPQEFSELIERVAQHHHGLGFLHQAYLESVAVTLRVHPFVVDAARAYLATPRGRAVMIEAVRDAHERSRVGTSPPPAPPADLTALPERSSEAEELIRRAEEHPRGVRVLADTPPEEVATTFAVHPYLVFRARGVLERRGIIPQGRSPGAAGQPPGVAEPDLTKLTDE
jgi:hypothetical protein